MKLFREDLRRWMTEIIAASIVVILMTVLFDGVCLSKLVFGLPCPGCGMTRAGILFLQGKFQASFQMHPMFVFLIPGIALFIYERYNRGRKAKVAAFYFIVFLVALFLVFLVRMRWYFPNQEPLTYFHQALIPVQLPF